MILASDEFSDVGELFNLVIRLKDDDKPMDYSSFSALVRDGDDDGDGDIHA